MGTLSVAHWLILLVVVLALSARGRRARASHGGLARAGAAALTSAVIISLRERIADVGYDAGELGVAASTSLIVYGVVSVLARREPAPVATGLYAVMLAPVAMVLETTVVALSLRGGNPFVLWTPGIWGGVVTSELGQLWLASHSLTVLLFFFIARRPASASGSSWNKMASSKDEVTRLAAASAVLNGTAFRRQVIEAAKERVHASPPELGLDFDLLLRVALRMDRRERGFEIALSSIGLLMLLAMTIVPPLALVLALFLVTAIVLKRLEERFSLAGHFSRGRYRPAKVRAEFDVELDERFTGLPPSDQNVTVYSGYTPFAGAGAQIATWSLVIDASRPKKDAGGYPSDPVHFEAEALDSEVERALRSARAPGMNVESCLFLHGADTMDLPGILPNAFERPQQVLPDVALQHYDNEHGDRARRYKRIQLHHYGNELIGSSFFRCSRVGQTVFLECSHYLLTPVADAYRTVDALPNLNWRTGPAEVLAAALAAPFVAALSPLALIGRLVAGVSDALELPFRAQRSQIRDTQRFNYGAPVSLRASMAGGLYKHYFQHQDYYFFQQLVDKRILSSIVDFLDAHGIDTSDVKEQTNVLMNQGVIVQNGNVEAQNLAVGSGARASGVFAKLKTKAAGVAAAAGGASHGA